MNTVEIRQLALAKRLGVEPDELQRLPDDGSVGMRFELQPGGYYWVYSSDEEKQAFKTRVPDLPFLSQIRDDGDKTYNVYLAVAASC